MPQVLRNPYTVLGVNKDASLDEIKSAYRRLALQYHPDRNPGNEQAEERFKEISEAYATLRDPSARERFDRYGSSQPEASRPDFSTVDWQTVFKEADVQVNWDARPGIPKTGNVVFDALFGAFAGVMRNSGLLPGEDRYVEAYVPIDITRGDGEQRVKVPGPSMCAECRGTGVLHGRRCQTCNGRRVLRGGSTIKVKIPAQAYSGMKLRLKALGGPGNPPGDVYIVLQVGLPRYARVEGNNIYIDIPVTPLEVARGKTLNVLGVAVTLPIGAQNHDRVHIRGGGVAGGDLYITLKLDIWRGLWRDINDRLRRAFLVQGGLWPKM